MPQFDWRMNLGDVVSTTEFAACASHPGSIAEEAKGERKKGVRGAGILRREKKEGGGVVELGIEEEGPR